MPTNITIIGTTNHRNINRPFGIYDHDRPRHMYIIGQTGMGKTTLLLNLIAQDMQNGRGLALIDPHGDLAEDILNLVPPNRVNDVIYFNPADLDYPIGFNPLEIHANSQKHLVASGLIEVFKKIWADSWGPRLEYILRNTILALLEVEGSTLLGIPKLLNDPEFRADIIAQLKDPILSNFWQFEYELYPKPFRSEAISPIQNKVGQFLSTPLMRNILGQIHSGFDLKDVMDSGKILIINLAKGLLGEDNSALLGSLLVSQLFQAGMNRASLPVTQRRPFAVYIDEFQNFASGSFASNLSEMRKYGIELILAHQYLAQLPESLRSSIFGNVGTIISFRIGAEDGEYISQEFLPIFHANDLISLPAYHIYLKLSIGGKTSEPFSALTLSCEKAKLCCKDLIIINSRKQYSTFRSQVEFYINGC